ncbi:MAG: MBL fold metallo-hydrolase [Victivallales bacterium]|jgi:phosphoribosyl 1,2-cyclic phosphodiesterase
MTITVLGSGSKGNSIVIQHGKSAIMVDAGFKLEEMLQKMEKANISVNSIMALFITHGHADHTVGISDLSRHASIPVYMTDDLFLSATGGSGKPDSRAWLDLSRSKAVLFSARDRFKIAGFEVTPVPVSHDSVSPVGFIVEAGGIKLSIVIDAGDISSQSKDAMRNSDVIMIESNYDPEMLRNSQRPFFLKRRISGPKGHLSNEKSADIVSEILSERTKDLVLLHLSGKCNTPELARKAALDRNPAIKDGIVNLHISDQDEAIRICISSNREKE